MPSEPGLFGGIYGRGAVAAQLSDPAWLQAMLDTEAALAAACAAEGLIPESSATAIASACRADRFDLAGLRAQAADHASPVVGLVAALRAALPAPVRPHVHLGATSQDILDTALMLIARRALDPLLEDARAAAQAAARLAETHRATPMIGRTLLQQALPITFGVRAAGWLVALDEARGRLEEIRDRELAVQMGGPVGAREPSIAAAVAVELGLAEPVVPWQANRGRPVALAAALGVLAGVLGKIARDVTLLAQQEVGEAREGDTDPAHPRGGSSAMAHKHNPVGAVSVLACVKRTPGLVAGALAAMEQEHERAAGAWQAEWGIHAELLGLTGSAAAWGRELLENLAVDPERMATNLAASPSGEEPLPPGAGPLIDRALAAHATHAAHAAPPRAWRPAVTAAVALHAEIAGPDDAPPLLMGGSLGTTLAMWDPQVAPLSRQHRLVRFDHRGHGGSPVPGGPYAIAELGQDVLALMDRLGLARAAYCGLSIGGMVGQWLAINAPERIDRLVLICTSAHLPPAEGWHERAAAVRAAGTPEVVADAVLARWFTPAYAEGHPDIVTRYRAMIADCPAEGYAACCEAIAAMDLRDGLPGIEAPTLVVAGRQDPAIPPEHGARIAAAVPGARLEVLDPGAHLSSVERADAVTALIADHLVTPGAKP